MCSGLSIPHNVLGTAVTYFQRFYLNLSVMDAEPKYVMMASVYLACKIDEHYISAEDLARMAKQDPSIVLRDELSVLSGLKFDLIVHHPYRSLTILQFVIADLSSREEEELKIFKNEKNRMKLMRSARSTIDAIMKTDALFIYPPGLLALGALRIALKALMEPSSQILNDRIFATIVEQLGMEAQQLPAAQRSESSLDSLRKIGEISSASFVPLMAKFDEIEEYVLKEKVEIDMIVVRGIDRQLRSCRNPVRNKDSDLYERVHAQHIQVREIVRFL